MVEALGMLFWKISVLVVGLRMAIVAPIHPTLLAWLARSVQLLLFGALALLALGLLRLLASAAGWALRRHADRHPAFGREVWRAWLHGDWSSPLAIDCALAAAIIMIAVTLAAREQLDWGCAAWIGAIGASRAALQQRRQPGTAR